MLLTLLCGLWICKFLVSQAHILHIQYYVITMQYENGAWLLEKCTQVEFYDNMKHHSSVCDNMSIDTRKIPILAALEHMVEKTYSCGYSPCFDTLDAVSSWMMGRGLLFTIALCPIIVTASAVLDPIFHRNMNVLADQRMKHLYNTAYGAPHYITTHQPRGRLGL